MISLLKESKYDRLLEHFIHTNTNYSILNKIGEGSYGIAYLLEHKETGEKTVLKRLKAKHRHTKNRLKFLQEVTFLKKLSPLPVPKVYMEGFIEELPFYIMEHVEGDTFEQAIFERHETFSIADTLTKTEELLDIMIVMHEQGIVHRDLRIPNIILQHNKITIIDFGLATNIDESVRIDQIDNPKKAASPVSDLYALGHFMLFLLYSTYSPSSRKSRAWQEELALPSILQNYIERLLMIQTPFLNALAAKQQLQLVKAALIQ
ncbi:MAG: serine/threonine protein kinase [Lysinibacillus sp.]